MTDEKGRIQLYRKHTARFVEEVLGLELAPWQRALLDAVDGSGGKLPSLN